MSDRDKHLDLFSSKKLRENEVIRGSVKGYISSRKKDSKDALMTGRLIVTDQRVCFYRHGFVGEKYESIDLPNVKSMETSSLLGHRSLKVYSTHNDLTFNSFRPKREFEEIITFLENPVRSPKTEVEMPSTADNSPVVRLKKLTDLHKAGLITEQEFAAKKSELLAQI